MSAQDLLNLVDANGVITLGLQDLLNAAGISSFDEATTSIKNLTTSAGDIVDNGDGSWTFVPVSDWDGTLPIQFETVSGEDVQPVSASIDSGDIVTAQENSALMGTDGVNYITGTDGNDTIISGGGNDVLSGGAGDDVFVVGDEDGRNRYDGGEGQDTIRGTTGDDVINFDSFTGDESIETIDGGEGDDTISVRYGADFSGTKLENIERIEGSNYGNAITGSDGDDVIVGGAGNDALKGGAGDDTFLRGPNDGEDQVSGGEGYDTVQGTDADDDIAFTNYARDDRVEHIDGGAGDDTVSVRYGGDFSETTMDSVEKIEGSGYNNVINGSQGDDVIDARGGSDRVDAQGGDDVLVYNFSENQSSYDRYDGGDGTDTLRIDLTGAEYNDPAVQADIAAFQSYLQAKEAGSAPENFKFSALGLQVKNIENLDVTVDGTSIFSNEAPDVAKPVSFNMDEDGNMFLTQAQLLQYASDADGDALSVQNLTVDGGTLTDNGDGTWFFTPDPDFNGTVQMSYDVSDGQTTTAATGSVTVAPVDDAAVVTGNTAGTVTEDATVTSSGTLQVTDPDAGQASFQSAMVSGAFGALVIDTAGNWSYSLANDNASVQALGEGDTLTDVVTVETADGTAQDVTITISGTNDVPQISGVVAGTVMEDGPDAAAGQLSISDVDTGESAFAAVTQAGTYGSFSVDETGHWTYTLTGNNADAVQALGEGDSLTESFTVTSADGTAAETVTVAVTGTNDVAQISGNATGAVVEDGTTVTTSGQLSVTDADGGEAVFAAGSQDGDYGSFSVDDAGNWTYNLTSNDSPEVQALGEGDVLTETFTVQTADGTTQDVTVTIAGSNDVARISGAATGAVVEDEALTASGQLAVSDVDTGEAVFSAATADGAYGTFSVDEAGHWTYNLTDGENPAVQSLGDGDSLTETFTVQTADGTSQTVTVSINGTNDAAQISGDTTGLVTEDASTPSASGVLSVTDVDTGENTVLAAEMPGSYGAFAVDSDGNWTYNLTAGDTDAVQSLGAGDTLTENFTVRSADGTAVETVTVTIEGTNDAAQITGDATGTVIEDAGPVATGQLLVSDADAGEASFVMSEMAGTYGAFFIDDGGNWTYNLTANDSPEVQALGEGDSLTETFMVKTADGTTQAVNVTIAGSNDAAQVSGETAGAVTEDTSLAATGQLSVTDVDAGEASFVAAEVAGSYGAFVVDQSGNWTYNLTANDSPEVQGLNAGDTLTETFTVKTADGTTQDVTVTINGSNDATAVTITGDTAGTVVEDGAATSSGQLATEAGAADNLSLAAQTATTAGDFAAASLDGAYGTFTMDDTGNWTYDLTANNSPVVQALGDGDTLTETFTVQTADGSASQEIKVTIAGTNDAPVVNATVHNVSEDQSLTITEADLLSEASDAEGDQLFVQNLTVSNGVLTANDNGSWTFTPDANFSGDVTFSYDVSDGTATTPVSTTISVAAAADNAQISGTATGGVTEDQAMLANGTLTVVDPDAGEAVFQVQSGTAGAYGNFSIDANGNWAYQLTGNNSAEVQALGNGDTLTETFTVKSADGSAMETVTVTIAGTNDAPVVTAPTFSTDQDVALTINASDLLSQATDIEGDALTAQNLTVDTGTLTDNGDGSWTYTPPSGWDGTANFSYDVFDGSDATQADSTITVNATAQNLNLIEGTNYNQTITGTSQDDLIIGHGGNDTMYGEAGDDVFEITTGDGLDVVSGGEGNDTLRGTSADDDIQLNQFWDANRVENIDGGAGNDVLHLRYHGDFSQTTISNLERIEGSSFRNYIYGSQGDDVISGAGGDDDLRGNAGDDVFLKTTGDGFDTIAGGEGFDTIQGTDADDRIDLYSYTGDNTVERIDGGAGTDTVGVKYHADFSNTEMVDVENIEGGSLANTIEGSQGDDNIFGMDGNDILTGNAGDDMLDGGAGTDTVVYGGAFIDYSINFNDDGTVSVRDLRSEGNEGADVVKNMEYIQFADAKLGLTQDAINAYTGADTGTGTGTGTDTGTGTGTDTGTGTGTDTGSGTGTDTGTGGGTTTPTETVLYNQTLEQPVDADDVVAVRFSNTGTDPAGNGPVTLGQVFQEGDIPAGEYLMAEINGQPVQIQMDVKATHPDGSVRHAVLTIDSPEIQPGDSVDIMLSHTPTPPAGATNVTAQDALANVDLSVDFTMHNADGTDTPIHLDAASALSQAIADGTLSTWLEGPLASEFSVDVPVNEQMHVTFNIRAFDDGNVMTDVVFAADKSFTAGNENLNYDVSIKEGGSEVYAYQNLDHHHKGTWHTEVWQGDDPSVHVIRDMDYFLKTGAVSNYDFSMGVKDSVLQQAYDAMQASDTDPMGTGTVETYMPGTGGRPDIGPLPTWAVRYLATQDERAEDVLFANADAAGGIPWHYVDENTGEVISIDDFPNIWLDFRDASGQLPDGFTMSGTDWTTDVAHMPSMTYLPYLLSGSQYYLDEMQVQANFGMASMNPAYRDYDGGIVDRHQLRGQAWAMRELTNVSWALPDDEPMKNYFADKLLNNLENYMNNYALLDPDTGEVSGAIQYPSGELGKISPWQDDYFTMVVALMADRGDTYAQDLLEWKTDFTAGRFLAEDFGFPAIAGTSYRLVLYEKDADGNKVWFDTWQEIMDHTFTDVGKDIPDELNYPDWAGGYAALARAAVASLVTQGQEGALEAYGFLVSETPNMDADYENDPTFSMQLEVDGHAIAHADEIVGTDQADTMTGTDHNELMHGGDGDDFILGHGGTDALFGGEGADTIDGGEGDDYLYGNQGDDVIIGGAGDDHIKGGKGADVLEGGEGHDTFIYDRLSEAGDTIKDFHDGQDVLDLREVMRVAGDHATVEITQGGTGAEVWIHTGAEDVLLTTVEGVTHDQLQIGDDVLIS